MAVIQQTLAEWRDGRAWLEVDDVALRALAIVVDQLLPIPVVITLIRDSDGRVYGQQTFGAGHTRVDLPQTGATRLDVSLNARGRFEGYRFHVYIPRYP